MELMQQQREDVPNYGEGGDAITQHEVRIIECRKRRDELVMALFSGGATLEQETEYKRACGDVHKAQQEYAAMFFGPAACAGEQTEVA